MAAPKANYQFIEGARYPVRAEIVGRELERIRTKYKRLQPRKVVEESRKKGAPLHRIFDWNDSSAAGKYRDWQARNLIRSVQIVRKDIGPVRAFIPIIRQAAEERHYQAIEKVTAEELALFLRELRTKIDGTMLTLKQVRRLAEQEKPDALAIVAAVHDALATARTLAEELCAA